MAEFKYVGKSLENKTVKGKIEAKDEGEAYANLKARGTFVYKITEVPKKKARNFRLKSVELADFSRQVGSMLGAGIVITKAIDILKDRAASVKIKNLYNNLYASITAGNTLSAAMEECGNAFPGLIINMFRAGEISGGLDKSALKMADFYDKEHKVNSKIKGAMVYPVILLILTILVTVLLFTFVMPKILGLFEGMRLPLITRVVLAISNAFTNYWYIILAGAITLITLTIKLIKNPKVAIKIDKMLIRIPKVKHLLIIIYTARFARTLSTLYSSGINMLEAVATSSKIIGNRFVAKQFEDVILKIKDGNLLSLSMENVKGIDKKLISSIYIGEETGKMDSMLLFLADSYDYEAEMSTAKLLTYIEPVMIIIMALIVGTIMAAVLLPVIGMYDIVG